MGLFDWFRKPIPKADVPVLNGNRMECGNCRGASDQPVLAGFSRLGSPDLDLRPPPTLRNKLHILMQRCPHCGYCSRNIGQPPTDTSVIRSAAYKKALSRADFPELARRFLANAVASSDLCEAAYAYLQAAWVCDDARNHARAIEARRLAADAYSRAQPFGDDEQGVALGAILVDILRRSCQFAEASAECTRLLAARAAVGDVRRVLEYQKELIARRDVEAHQVSETRKEAEQAAAPPPSPGPISPPLRHASELQHPDDCPACGRKNHGVFGSRYCLLCDRTY